MGVLILSLIITHIGLFYVYYKTRNELLELKSQYDLEKSQLEVNNALFENEGQFTKEEIQSIMSKFLDYDNLRDYLYTATQRLESRPEEVRSELKKELRERINTDRELLNEIKTLNNELFTLRQFTLEEIPAIKRKISQTPQSNYRY